MDNGIDYTDNPLLHKNAMLWGHQSDSAAQFTYHKI